MEPKQKPSGVIRYGLPEGSLWVLKSNGKVYSGPSREVCEENAINDKTLGQNGFPLPYAYPGTQVPLNGSPKNPMLCVGTNNYLRQVSPFFLQQRFDMHVYFQPNAEQEYIVGIIALSRTKLWEEHHVFAKAKSVKDAVISAVAQLVGVVAEETPPDPDMDTPNNNKRAVWISQWIYRLPKISLKDVLHLEDYQ